MRLAIALLVTTACHATEPRPPSRDPAFPRIASYRIETSIDRDAEAMLRRVSLAIVDAEVSALDPDALRRIRAANGELDLLAYLTSEEIPRMPDPHEHPLADARFARIPASAWLTEPGSITIAPVDAQQTRIRVRDPAAFAVHRPPSSFYPADEPTYLLFDDEHVRLLAIDGDELVVDRGVRSRAVAHPGGTRIAAHVVFFAGTWMLDLVSPAWRSVLIEEAVSLVVRGPWNGVFLDVCFEDVAFLNGGVLDVDRDGRADAPAYASARWREAFATLVAGLRARLGDRTPIVANPGAQNCPHAQLDGILLEGFPIGLPASFLDFDTGLRRYLGWTQRPGRRPLTIANAYSPKIGFGEIAEGQNELARDDFAAMRFGLAIALLGDGYYTFDNGVFGHNVAWWYDEYDGAGRGTGWLGRPRGAPYRIGAAWARAFTGGFVVANPTDAPIEVAVPAGYRKLAGRQDPVHNDGLPVTAPLVVGARDGYLLVAYPDPR